MLFSMGDDLSYGLNTLGPLCLWQCFIAGQFLSLCTSKIIHIQRKPKSTTANGEKTAISENGMTKKSKDREEKKLSDTEDLLEDLGRATDKVIEW